MPFIFATILAIFLYPINKKINKKIKYDWLSITLSFFSVLIPVSLIGMLFSYQLIEIIDSLPSISKSLKQGAESAINWIQGFIPAIKVDPAKYLTENIGSNIDGPINMVKQSLMSSTSFIIALFLTFIYTFLILYYRKSIKNFLLYQFEKQSRSDMRETLTKIKLTVQSYIGGLFIVIAILSVVNSLGLWIIGVDYPLFWGTLAGFLAVIPYIGTGLGGLLPFLYSLATADNNWQPIAIVIFYGIIQTIEGNLLTPKIVGDKVNINPLFAILSLVLLGSLWGIAGVILALPLISILRIILSQFEPTLPLAILMSSNVEHKADKFQKLNND